MATKPALKPGLREVALDRLRPSPDNPRTISPDELERLRGMLRSDPTFMRARPICAMPDGRIYAGEMRWRALRDEGIKRAPAYIEQISEALRRERMLRDNTHPGDWVPEEVAQMVASYEGAGGDVGMLGFDDSEISSFMASISEPATEPPVPPVPKKPVTRSGDLWQLGDHRLVCGDSTKQATQVKLDLAPFDLIFSSPPYNVGVKYDGDSTGDQRGWPAYRAFLEATLAAWLPGLAEGRAIGWNVGVAPDTFPAHQHLLLEELGLTFWRQIVWDKLRNGMPLWFHTEKNPVARNWTPDYNHELILVFSKGKPKRGKRIEPDDLARSSVIGIIPQTATRDLPAGEHSSGSANPGLKRSYTKAHPAVYPVRLPEVFMRHLTGKGETVADPFAGAGSTLLACERNDRVHAGAEIDPGFCDVTIERWETETGGKAKRRGRRKRS